MPSTNSDRGWGRLGCYKREKDIERNTMSFIPDGLLTALGITQKKNKKCMRTIFFTACVILFACLAVAGFSIGFVLGRGKVKSMQLANSMESVTNKESISDCDVDTDKKPVTENETDYGVEAQQILQAIPTTVGSILSLTPGSTVTQSSGINAELALDGNGNYSNVEMFGFTSTCTWTIGGSDKYPWFAIEMKQISVVKQIIMHTASGTVQGVVYDYVQLRVGPFRENKKNEKFYRNGICGWYGSKTNEKNGDIHTFECPPNLAARDKTNRSTNVLMAPTTEEVLKLPVQLWLTLCISFLLLINSMSILYWSIFVLPLSCILIQKLVLKPVAEDVADDVVGPPLSLSADENKGGKRILIAHRTCGLEAPENTLAGIRKAKEDGATGVEFDVRFTKDNVAVLIHDSTVDRTTNGSGHIGKMMLNDVKKLDASCHHFNHSRYVGETVPTLDEAVHLCLDLDLKIFLEAKDVDERAFKTIVEMYKQEPQLYDKCAVVSFYPHFLYRLRRRDPKIVTVLVWRPEILSMVSWSSSGINCIQRFPDNKFKQCMLSWADNIFAWCVHNVFWRVCGVSGVFIHKSVISHNYLSRWAHLEMRVVAWVVDDPFEKEYFNSVLGLNYMTDAPRHVLNHPSVRNLCGDKNF
uniref:GP-PDE domain-containing protein n=1 Tax=Strigamia maritima TaxID=126957 RepID=T1J412_STRMM